MSRPSSVASESCARREAKSRTTLAAFLLGLPMAAGILALIHYGPARETELSRYVSHPLECVEVVMFCAATGALIAKLWGSLRQRRACYADVLPDWDGKPIPVAEASNLLAQVDALPRWLQHTSIVRRTANVLEFLRKRGSAVDLDDHLRNLTDVDTLALEGSYALTRFITWAIPILGFLGTVLGITGAISGVTPEKLENSLNTVTDGLALAFDATALALGLTMVTMFCTSLVERLEQGILDDVDRFADSELAHRFERLAGEGSEVVDVVRQNTRVLVGSVEQLVQRQTELWADTIQEADSRRLAAESLHENRMVTALQTAVQTALEAHQARLSQLEDQVIGKSTGLLQGLESLSQSLRAMALEQQSSMREIVQALRAQAETFQSLQEGETSLCRLQETLNQNLAAVSQTGTFEEALHSLTAAVHLLTSRAQSLHTTPAPRAIGRPGAAA